ncbi:pre-60S factor rei1 [Friedmanniomyces endolithicus]|nr:pre-60S factor rei1 [Friedmanniomyces endolithicus]
MATTAQSQSTAAPTMLPSSHPYTCNTCQIALKTSDLQRQHMQSDWHRYNLKRRVASLPPLTSEVFADKVLSNKAATAATAARASFEKACDACDKTYYSEGAYANHLGSQKHRVLLARLNAKLGNETESLADSIFSLGEPIDTASTTASTATLNPEDQVAEEEFEEVVEGIKKTGLDGPADPVARPSRPTPSSAAPVDGHAAQESGTVEDGEEEHKADLNECLFCNYMSPNLELNITHMSRQHGFFIPEREFLIDLPGLVNYLSETITVLHTCLYCHKGLHTASGIQTHMRDRGHCMIAYSTEEDQMDVGEYYDFRSTYSDEGSEADDEEHTTNGGVSLGVKREVKTTAQGENGEDVDIEDGDEGWESDSTLSSVPTDEITSVPIEHRDHNYAKLDKHRHHSHSDPRPHKNTDGFHSHAHHGPTAVYHDDYELHLPSGRTAGHRSLRVYYRQNLRNYPSAEERSDQRMLEDGRHNSDDDELATGSTETNGTGRGRQVVSRANGGLGMIGVSERTKQQVKAIEKRDIKKQQRAQNRYQAGNEKRNNFQKHFRDPLLQ